MDGKSQAEKLEQELNFLKESFDAEVISKEEFEKGKERIKKKLKGLQNNADEQSDIAAKKQAAEKEPKEEEKQNILEEAKEEKIKPGKETKTEKQETPEKKEPAAKIEEKTAEERKEEPKIKIPEGPEHPEEPRQGKDKFWKYAIIFAVLFVILSSSSYFFMKELYNATQNKSEIKLAECNSDAECVQEGMMGICANAGRKDAKCEFRQIEKIKVIVVNEKNRCFNCDTARVAGILENWFGPLEIDELDYGSREGKLIAEKLGLKMLPAYIFYENITANVAFRQFSQAFRKKDKYYVLSEDASGATFYLDRQAMQNKLDFFAIDGDIASAKAENNLKEFLQAFGDVDFKKHNADEELAKELRIKSFPSFLINNNIRFSGIHPAESIKRNFCSVNKAEECELKLSEKLI